jgi:O-antigen ligase
MVSPERLRMRVRASPVSPGLQPRLALMLGLAGLDGLLAGPHPQLAVLGALGVAFLLIMLADLTVGLCFFVLASFLDVIPQVGGGVSIVKALGLLLVVTWLASAGNRGAADSVTGFVVRHRVFLAALLAFLAWGLLSMLWAEAPLASASIVARLALNFTLFPIVFAAVGNERHVTLVFATFVGGGVLTTIWALLTPTNEATSAGRLSGSLNPNQLGNILMVAAILAGALALTGALSRSARTVASLTAVGCAIALFATLSRGSLLGFCVAALVAPFVAGSGRRAGTFIVVVTAVVTAFTFFLLVASSASVSRITHPGAGGGAGRADLWKIAWQMVDAHPVRGIGAGNFANTSVDYLFRTTGLIDKSTPAFVVDTPKVPHNIYLQVLAELGIIGAALFVGLVGFAWICSLRAAGLFRLNGDRDLELLARGLFIATTGLLAAEFFASELYSKRLWIVLAAGPALRGVAERRAAMRARAEVSERVTLRPQPRVRQPATRSG